MMRRLLTILIAVCVLGQGPAWASSCCRPANHAKVQSANLEKPCCAMTDCSMMSGLCEADLRNLSRSLPQETRTSGHPHDLQPMLLASSGHARVLSNEPDPHQTAKSSPSVVALLEHCSLPLRL